ncbi:hypothetical protein H1R20_g3986, partial [Candolleomyces eurysporus]
MSSAQDISLSIERVEKLIQKHVLSSDLAVVKLAEAKNHGFRCQTAGFKIYVIDLHGGDKDSTKTTTASCFLTISKPDSTESSGANSPNTLAVIHTLLALIRDKTSIPISDSILDTSHDIIPFDFLLSPPTPFSSSDIITLREAKAQGLLDAKHQALIDLQIGQLLAQLHTNVQNDWYGRPALKGEEPSEPSYSWQETFTLLFDTLLSRVKEKGYDLPQYSDIQTHMSRAIAFSVFDDVEVPSLVWFTGSDADIYLSLPTSPSTKTPGIVAILPSMPYTLWGDPLLETFFLQLESCKAVLEGYTGSGGGPLVSFPRQKTKRVWYTLFLALTVLDGYLSSSSDAQEIPEDKKKWAEETIAECTEILKTAPCY